MRINNKHALAKNISFIVNEVFDLGILVRWCMDAPEVDGKVYLSDDFDAEPGYLMWVKIIHADEHDV